MSEPLPDAGQAERPAAPRTYRVLAAPSEEAIAFLVIEIGADGHELTLLSCATREEARHAKAALEQLDAAEARARGWCSDDHR